jgi:hypothetical protein
MAKQTKKVKPTKRRTQAPEVMIHIDPPELGFVDKPIDARIAN